jgi:hypothetical protein
LNQIIDDENCYIDKYILHYISYILADNDDLIEEIKEIYMYTQNFLNEEYKDNIDSIIKNLK